MWTQEKGYSQDQVNAVSLLWRLELRGVPALTDRWADVGEWVARRGGPEHVQPFLDLHYLVGLAKSGRMQVAQQWLDSMAQHAVGQPRVETIAVPIARGVVCWTQGTTDAMAAAVGDMAAAFPGLVQIGGAVQPPTGVALASP